jgi:16S rRNA A1518/A1519 N6-dimethyltransferase RsmA/KsgA/DIM1 with predicted DNA glycosylase/AP lyase activity
MMLKLLKQDWPPAQARSAFDRLGLAPQVRAEELALETFVRLAELLGP